MRRRGGYSRISGVQIPGYGRPVSGNFPDQIASLPTPRTTTKDQSLVVVMRNAPPARNTAGLPHARAIADTSEILQTRNRRTRRIRT